jgi:hypothetical protein
LTKQEFSDNGRGVAAKKTTSTPELDAKHSSTEWPMSTEIPNLSVTIHDVSHVGNQPTQTLASVTKTDDDDSTSRYMDWDDIPEPVCLYLMLNRR